MRVIRTCACRFLVYFVAGVALVGLLVTFWSPYPPKSSDIYDDGKTLVKNSVRETIPPIVHKRTLSQKRASKRKKGPLKKKFPQVIIIGLPRCGSEAFSRYLGLHPDIAMRGGETMYFDRNKNFKKGLDWYLSEMPPSRPGQITIERSPTYFNPITVPERVYEFNKDVKLMAIFKDPVTRMISSYTRIEQDRYGDDESKYRDLEDIILEDDGSLRVKYNPLDIGNYHTHLQRWLKFFPKENILLLDGETFLEDPISELKRAETFLGLSQYLDNSMFTRSNKTGHFCRKNSKGDPVCFTRKGSPRLTISKRMTEKLWDHYDDEVQAFCKLADKEFRPMSWCGSQWDKIIEKSA